MKLRKWEHFAYLSNFKQLPAPHTHTQKPFNLNFQIMWLMFFDESAWVDTNKEIICSWISTKYLSVSD